MESDLLVVFKAEFDAIWPLVSLKSVAQEPPAERGLHVTLMLRGGCLTLDQIIFPILGKLKVSSLNRAILYELLKWQGINHSYLRRLLEG